MRLPVTPQISTKDGISNKNSRLTNMLKESRKTGDLAVVRPGLVLDAQASGVGNGLVAFNNELVSVYGATLGFGVTEPSNYSFTETTFPSSIGWGVCAYGNGVFVAVQAQSDAVASSSDGITWTPSTLPYSSYWTACAYGNGVFVMVADGTSAESTDAATSIDGDAWDYQSMPFQAGFSSIAFNGTKFCAVCYDVAEVAISLDGVTWDYPYPISANSGNYQITSNGSDFVAVGIGGATVSTDNGATWADVTIHASYANWSGIAWQGGLYCATRGGFAIGTKYATSPDGVNWTLRDFPLSKRWYVTASNSKFLAYSYIDDEILISSDGITWEEHVIPWSTGMSSAASDGIDFAVGAYPSANKAAVISTEFQQGTIPALSEITGDRYDFAQSPL